MYQEEMDNEDAPNKTSYTGFNRRILISIKLEAIKYAKENNNVKATQKFNVIEGTIRYWRKNKSLFKEVGPPTKIITIHGCRKANFIKINRNRKSYHSIFFNI